MSDYEGERQLLKTSPAPLTPLFLTSPNFLRFSWSILYFLTISKNLSDVDVFDFVARLEAIFDDNVPLNFALNVTYMV